ncbi:MAG: hypothetical protein GDA48_13135 [Hormoscilla sp. GM102CHS1]|nr:hypothetical protein [Hormoscilla sp. GM102CHS1]
MSVEENVPVIEVLDASTQEQENVPIEGLPAASTQEQENVPIEGLPAASTQEQENVPIEGLPAASTQEQENVPIEGLPAASTQEQENVPVEEMLDASTQLEISGIERVPFLAGFQREGHLFLPFYFANNSVKWTFEDFVFEEKWEDCKVSLKGSIGIYLSDPSKWTYYEYCERLDEVSTTYSDGDKYKKYYGAFMAYRDANYDSEYRLYVRGKEYCTFTLGELNSSIELENFFSTAALQKAVNYFLKFHKNDNRFKRESASFPLRLTKQNENEEGYVILPKVKLYVDVENAVSYLGNNYFEEYVNQNILLLTQIFIPKNCKWVVPENLYLEGLKLYENLKRLV